MILMIGLSKELLEQAYRSEDDPNVKERLLLVIRGRDDGVVSSCVAGELHRTKPWASKWLKRFEAEGIDGLKDRPRSGRPGSITSSSQLRIRRVLSQRTQGWKVKEVWQMIHREADVTLSIRQVYRLLHRWGYRTIVPMKRFVKTASKEEKQAFKKG